MNKTLDQGFRVRLKNERVRLGLSQADFAEKAGIKRSSQHLYENNENAWPNLRYLLAINEMGVDIQYVLFNKQAALDTLCLFPNQLRKIYRAVEEFGVDKKGNLLAIEERENLFLLLCTRYADLPEQEVEPSLARALIK